VHPVFIVWVVSGAGAPYFPGFSTPKLRTIQGRMTYHLILAAVIILGVLALRDKTEDED